MNIEKAIEIQKELKEALLRPLRFRHSNEEKAEAIDIVLKELENLNLENQALYESINCNDDNMLARRYEKLQKELEQEKEKNKALEEINFRVNLNVIELEEKNNRQLEIDTAEEVLKWKGKYHLLSRKINGVLEDKIKEQIKVFKKEGSQTSLIIASVLEDILKENNI